MADRLYIVVPCYNEEDVLEETASRLVQKLRSLAAAGLAGEASRILFVDDGSKDRTWELIDRLHRENPQVSGLKLSRNQGHQNALLAGLMAAARHADVSISMDADLQDDIDAMDRMLEHYSQGSDIVYGVRSDRSSDTAFKRGTAQGFYKVMEKLGVNIIYNHADYRLMSRRALEGLAQFGEANLFLRGIVPLIGYSTAVVEYERGERFAGESKYPLKKMIAFALNGITSFSIRPIRLIALVGFLIFLASGFFLAWGLLAKLLGYTVQGWSTLMMSIWFLGGLQLFALGIIGEYVGKIYNETKRRPKYFVDKFLNE